MRLRSLVVTALAAALAVVAAQSAAGSRTMRVGIYDEAQTLYGPAGTFATLGNLHVQELRLNLYWGGRYGVAKRRPARPTDPSDPAYNWALYDHAVRQAASKGMHVVFSIYGTPSWENGAGTQNTVPRHAIDLRNFAYAAARRYSGAFYDQSGKKLPAVKEWLAWNEPNNPVFLAPQYRRVGGRWVVESAIAYAAICNSIYSGVHSTFVSGERVACGVTAPRGNNAPTSSRPSVSPLAFLHAVKAAGLHKFDAWAHHPYYAGPADAPAARAGLGAGVDEAVTLGNIGDLVQTVTQLYGKKQIWITEYGYQTNPPDNLFGVTWAKQARYLTQAFAIARANPHVTMMLWFLLKDENALAGWQSGLETVSGKKKPSFSAFRRMAAAGRSR